MAARMATVYAKWADRDRRMLLAIMVSDSVILWEQTLQTHAQFSLITSPRSEPRRGLVSQGSGHEAEFISAGAVVRLCGYFSHIFQAYQVLGGV